MAAQAVRRVAKGRRAPLSPHGPCRPTTGRPARPGPPATRATGCAGHGGRRGGRVQRGRDVALRTRGNPELLDQAAQATFAAQASKECAAVLPTYRVVLTSSVDGPSISAATDHLDLLGQHLSDLPATGGLQALVVEWLQAWKNYIADQRHYANIIGPAGRLHGHPVLRQMPGSARLAASLAHQQVDDQAVQADRESANLGLTACRLEQGQTA